MLRLGTLKLNKEDYPGALDSFSDAIAIDPKNINAWAMVAHTHLLKKSYRSARKTFEHINRDLDRHDGYALCGVGNEWLRIALDEPDREKREPHIKRAVEYFCIALKHRPNNIRATAGIAVAYAQTGHPEEASQIFNQLQGSAPKDLSVILNAAHVLVSTGKVQTAIGLYESLLKKPSASLNPDILTAIARSHYITAKTNVDPLSIVKAREYVEKAKNLAPNDKSHLFNLALTMQAYADILNKIPAEKRELKSIEALQEALEDLDSAQKIFEELAREKKWKGYSHKQAEDRGKYCTGLRRVSEKNIHAAEVFQKQREERMLEIKERKLRLEKEAEEKKVV
jgi:tetratricopeptide (TPR) repeat protein